MKIKIDFYGHFQMKYGTNIHQKNKIKAVIQDILINCSIKLVHFEKYIGTTYKILFSGKIPIKITRVFPFFQGHFISQAPFCLLSATSSGLVCSLCLMSRRILKNNLDIN